MKRDFNLYPMLVAWEMTQACLLACKHCRASAEPNPLPGELSPEEGLKLLEELAGFDPKPILLPTGGDPLRRADLFMLLERARELGLVVGITPAVTPLLTIAVVERFKALGVHQMAVSLDGASAQAHDGFMGVPGTFERALAALEWAREVGLLTQVNTTVTRLTATELPGIARIAAEKGVATWEVFFLVPIGRGALLHQLSPQEYDSVMHTLYEISRDSPYKIRTTEGPQFRRVVMQRRRQEGSQDQAQVGHGRGVHLSDGNGFVFVSATGEVYPSGFLARSGGNVRTSTLREIYQNNPMFTQLRDKSLLEGRCGVCEYQQICGGSRARAWAETGNYLGSDPRCDYQPKAVAVYSE